MTRARRAGRAGVAVFAALIVTGPVAAQSLQERIEEVRLRRAQERAVTSTEVGVPAQPSVDALLNQRVDFAVRNVGFREALERWSAATQVPLLINWAAMELDGVDPDVPINVTLEQLPAAQVLLVLLDVGSTEFRFIAEVEPWGVQIRTREQANRDVQVRVYDVRDLVMTIPSFDDAPGFELSDALESGGGQGSGGSSGGLFDDADEDDEDTLSKQERGDALAETIRQTVEPDIWQANGGELSRIRYYDGRLVVRAPAYVHSQIAGSAMVGAPDTPTGYTFRTRAQRSAPATPQDTPGDGTDVSGVEANPQDVAGVAE